MAKSEKEKPLKKTAAKPTAVKKASPRSGQLEEEDEDIINIGDEKPKKLAKQASAKSNADEDDTEGGDVVEIDEEWNKGEEGEDWDPDFNEFDLPKSNAKKVVTGKKAPKDDDDDFKVDDEFKDMFGGGSSKGRYNDDDNDDY